MWLFGEPLSFQDLSVKEGGNVLEKHRRIYVGMSNLEEVCQLVQLDKALILLGKGDQGIMRGMQRWSSSNQTKYIWIFLRSKYDAHPFCWFTKKSIFHLIQMAADNDKTANKTEIDDMKRKQDNISHQEEDPNSESLLGP